jgi:hypothetical protein
VVVGNMRDPSSRGLHIYVNALYNNSGLAGMVHCILIVFLIAFEMFLSRIWDTTAVFEIQGFFVQIPMPISVKYSNHQSTML